jgi:hypothetical protein
VITRRALTGCSTRTRAGTAPQVLWTSLRRAAQYRCAPVNADVRPRMEDRSPSDVAEEWIRVWSGPEPAAIGPGCDSVLDWELPLDSPELAWLSILAVLETIGPNVEDRRFAVLAAGPLEDLMDHHGDSFIDRAEAEARRNPAFALLLGGVWRSTIAEHVWERMGMVAKRGW